ncbi:MAG: hypothetical protein QOK05_1182 [Chloroflexota bacterium]|jgi:hypothetical protein|nr:hypothetical protein [Chloroflexota bacterium]
MKRDLAWLGAALAIVAVSRLLIPGAPALYEGIQLPTEPFHYCNPPANLATSNKQPGSGAGELPLSSGLSQLGSINTSDNQLLTFFPKGALQADGAAKYKLTLKPECQPPAPPAGNKVVGDAYNIDILGEPGDTPVRFLQPAQVLMRTPPVAYTSVQLYYDAGWHGTQWGQQQDIANITINHVGVVALLDDGRKNPAGKPPGQQATGIVTIVEVILVSAALGIVVAAIIVQKRRGREAGKTRRA